MKILEINKYFFVKGGCEAYYFNLIELLEKNGHKIMHFSMKHPMNFASEYEDYFIKEIDYTHQSIKEKVINAGKIIYSFEAKKKLRELIRKEKPDIAHLHNIYHQLSPSIILELKNNNIPIILTAHDFKLICPNYKLYHRNHICEKCKKYRYYNCLLNKCMKGSVFGSLVNTVEMYFHYFLKSYTFIDKIITPSQFLKDKFIEFGYPEVKIQHLYNFVDLEKYVPTYKYEDYFLHFGRISEDKGIMTLLKAMKNVSRLKLYIVGDGPHKTMAEAYVKLNNISNVSFFGYKTGEELLNIIANAKFITINSELYENNPMSVIESMALSKCIVGSRIGGIPELVQHQVNGMLYEPGNAKELSDSINYLIDHEELFEVYGRKSHALAQAFFDKENHYLGFKSIVDEIGRAHV